MTGLSEKWHSGEGPLPASRNQNSDVLQVEVQVRGHGISEMRRLRLLEEEKRATEEDRGAASAGYRRIEGGVVKKVVGPRAEREAVRVAREEGQLSERRACGLIGMSRGSWRYRKKERDEVALRKRLLEMRSGPRAMLSLTNSVRTGPPAVSSVQ